MLAARRDDVPRKAGIYRIVNPDTGCEYIGSAIDLRRRRTAHRNALLHGRHHNARLQRAWAKGCALRFEVVEIVADVSALLAREQHHLDSPAKHGRYNVCLVAGSAVGRECDSETRAKIAAALRGRKRPADVGAKVAAALLGCKRGPCSAETRAKIGAANRGLGLGRKRGPRSAEVREKIAAAQRGRQFSAETRERMRAARLGKALSAESRAKVSATLRGRPKSAEHNAKVSEAIKAHWVLRRARASEAAERARLVGHRPEANREDRACAAALRDGGAAPTHHNPELSPVQEAA